MGQPDVTVRVEPGDGVSVFYLRLAPETASSLRMCKIGLYLEIKNNDTDINPDILHLDEVKVSFSDIDIDIPTFNHGVDIPKNDEGKWGMIGGPKANGGEYIKLPYPPPPQTQMNIQLYFENFDTPVILNRSLTAHVSPVEGGSYYFPGKREDLNTGEFWAAPETHWSGGDEIFAYDLKVISWNSVINGWSHICAGKDGTKKEDYLAWNKPVYALADGKVIHCVDGIEDNPNPDPTGTVFSGEDKKRFGNVIYVQHGDEIVRYAHLRNGSLNESKCNENSPGYNPNVLAGDLLGRVGNSGHTTDPHLHIHATKGNHPTSDPLRPIPFHDIQVLNVEPSKDIRQSWVMVYDEGLPAVNTAIWPSARPYGLAYPLVDKWVAVALILFGIIQDGSGFQFSPGGRPVPVDPWGPLRRLSSMKQDILVGLAITELASIINDPESKLATESAGIDVMSKAIKELKKSLSRIKSI